jgi:hypothetical protein
LCSFTCCSFVAIAEEKAAFATEKNEQTQTVQLEKYTNSEKGYSIEYPSDWKKNDVPQLDLVLFAPTQKNDDKPHASMNIVSEKVGPGINLEQFYSESANNLTSALKDVQVEKTGSIQLNGTTSKWMLYTHVMQGVKFRVLQYFIVAEETIFLMTFSASDEDFNQYRQDFENIASTFKVFKTAASPVPAPTPLKTIPSPVK